MSNSQKLLILILIIGITFSCKEKEPVSLDLTTSGIIPKPVSLEATNSSFEITPETVIYYQQNQSELKPVAQYLADLLNPSTGFNIQVKVHPGSPEKGNIYLTLVENDTLGTEGYDLQITSKIIWLQANNETGLFRGIQTLRQILPARIERTNVQEGPWLAASGHIKDYPAYGYRGAMLDVARHFFTVEEVKRYIDLMALYKFNALHLHLTDDQGWRIEIKSWPNLTEHGGSTEVGGGEGGFYTQEEYQEIVRYAADRFIMIVPEIDMPGHTNAALASYPELNCDGKATELYTGTKVGFSTLCTDKEITYEFLDDVIGELADLTPGPYIHIGGDESHVTPLEDYVPFIERVQKIVTRHGKYVLGWDEIAHADLETGVVVQHWASLENAENALDKGANLLMSPASRSYIDMKYDSTTELGLNWAGYIEVDHGYTWDPVELVPGTDKTRIIGIETPLWSETVTNIHEAEYMMFPRMPGYAEIGWTPRQMRSWDEYRNRLADHKDRFEALEINYYPSPKVPW